MDNKLPDIYAKVKKKSSTQEFMQQAVEAKQAPVLLDNDLYEETSNSAAKVDNQTILIDNDLYNTWQ